MKRFTHRYIVCLWILILTAAIFAQPEKIVKTTSKKPFIGKQKESEKAAKEAFEQIKLIEDLAERASSLRKFINDFQKSSLKETATDALVLTLTQIAEEKFSTDALEEGIEFYRKALKETSSPISDELFLNVILPMPKRLLELGQMKAFDECEKIIEQKIGVNSKQAVVLAAFHISREDSETARRIIEAIIPLEPNNAAAQNILGTAYRMNFQIEDAEQAYSKTLSLEPTSLKTKLYLADMQRALGKTESALNLYRQILEQLTPETLEKNPNGKFLQSNAQNGVVMSLFNLNKPDEAETELKTLLENNPKNAIVLAGAAYWYAANRKDERAIELANQALAIEPRYVWTHIALARALISQKRPLEAETTLLFAKQYANFPTLDYELASARAAAGFYEEAADDLRRQFTIKDNKIETLLGGKMTKSEDNFVILLQGERLASIFEPLSADSLENSKLLKNLLNFSLKITAADAKSPEKEAELAEAVDNFVAGDDMMKTHRQIFASSRLLQKQLSLPKVLELMKNAPSGVDIALNAPAPNAAILADELLEPRKYAFLHGTAIIVPDIPRQTLLAILRGRIEEITGWTLFNQGKYDEAVVRLKRAVSVAPDKSAWWRSSLWKLATAMDAAGKSRESLDIYANVYKNSPRDESKRRTIEMLYVRLFGSALGIEKFLGESETETAKNKSAQPKPTPVTTPKVEDKVEPKAEITSEITPDPKIEPTPTPEIKIEPKVETPALALEIKTDSKVEPSTTPVLTPNIEDKVEPKIEPTPEITAVVKTEPTPTPDVKVEPTPAVVTDPKVEEKVEPTPEVVTDPKVEDKVEPKPEATPEIKPDLKVEPTPTPETKSDAKVETPTLVLEVKPDSKVEPTPTPTEPKTVEISPSADVPQCRISLAHPAIWLESDGGTLGIVLLIEGKGSIDDVKPTSSSPSDIDVTLQSDIGKTSNRAWFLIRSVSPKTGDFTVNFESPCGKQELKVTVR